MLPGRRSKCQYGGNTWLETRSSFTHRGNLRHLCSSTSTSPPYHFRLQPPGRRVSGCALRTMALLGSAVTFDVRPMDGLAVGVSVSIANKAKINQSSVTAQSARGWPGVWTEPLNPELRRWRRCSRPCAPSMARQVRSLADYSCFMFVVSS